MDEIQIKIYFRNEIKRITIKETISLFQFQKEVIKNSEILEFLDEEEDWCTIDSEETWRECKNVYKKELVPKILKIKLQDRVASEVFQDAFMTLGSNVSELFSSFTDSFLTVTTTPMETGSTSSTESFVKPNMTMTPVLPNKPIYRPVYPPCSIPNETKTVPKQKQEKSKNEVKHEVQILKSNTTTPLFDRETQIKLQLLKDMGFENEQKNLYLLKKFNNDIESVVRESLSNIF
eukprot:gene12337-6010_t